MHFLMLISLGQNTQCPIIHVHTQLQNLISSICSLPVVAGVPLGPCPTTQRGAEVGATVSHGRIGFCLAACSSVADTYTHCNIHSSCYDVSPLCRLQQSVRTPETLQCKAEFLHICAVVGFLLVIYAASCPHCCSRD